MKKGLFLIFILSFILSLTAVANVAPTGVNDGFGTLKLNEASEYEIAPADINSTGSAITIGEWTAFDKDMKLTGLYAVREILDSGVSDYTLAYAYGDLAERQNILDMSPDGKHFATCRDVNNNANTDLFYQGQWSGSVSPSGSLGADTLFAHAQIDLTPYYNAKTALDALNEGDSGYEAALTKVNEENTKLLKNCDKIVYRYAFDREGVIKVNEADKITLRFFCNNSTFITKTLTTKFVAYVSDRQGNITTYSKSYTQEYASVSTNKSFAFSSTVNFADFLPDEGFLVAFEFYPNTDNPKDNIVKADSGAFRYATWFKTNSYVINAPAQTPADKPILSLTTKNAVIKVTNYNQNVTYAYSDDGKSYTPFDTDSFSATKASTSYTVKALANGNFLESEVSEPITSPAITVVGTSLVLDGRIGLKVYMDIDTDIINNPNLYMTRVNNDYICSEGDENYPLFKKGGGASFTTSTEWCDKITYDSEKELYSTVVYMAAKDVDNIRVECDLGGFPDNVNRVSYSNLGGSLTYAKYIEKARALAASGNEEFVKALDLINALDNYTKYCDNYFNEKSLASYTSNKLDEMKIPTPSITKSEPDGIKFHSTSLLLEDKISIRHYFKVTDLDTYLSKYTCDIPYKVNGDYIYFDIENISAEAIATPQKLSIKDSKGVIYEIEFSVANYIELAKSSNNTRLVSLINTMYDYYLEAKSYLKPKPLYLSYDEDINYESAQGGLNIYIPTKEGYINHIFSRTVSSSRNADIWRLSRAFAVDDKLENPLQLTVDNAEWDMALKIVGRDDFVGGWMHGDEIMTDIKFVIDGVETDVTLLDKEVTFELLTIVENSIGYDPSNPKSAAFNHKKVYTIDHSGIRLDQRVEWLDSFDVEYSYLAMMPPKKELTDSYFTNNDTTPKTIDYSNGQINSSSATSVTVFGKNSGYYFTMEVNEYDTFIKPYMSIADNGGGPYHKMYFGFVNKGSVLKGDIWETMTKYKIEKK